MINIDIKDSDAVKFTLQDIVYLRLNPEVKGVVTGILFRPHGVLYFVSWEGEPEGSHYDFELTKEKGYQEIVGGISK